MTGRWKRKTIKDNNGKSLVVSYYGEYEICLNINRGRQGPGVRDSHGDHWVFEVAWRGKHVGEAPNLAGAKRVAAAHAKEKNDV